MKLRVHSAYSLIFAFVIMTVMMLIAASAVESSNNQIAERDPESQGAADDAAASAVEEGILAMKNYGAGFESSEAYAFCYKSDGTRNDTGNGNCENWGNYRVYGKAQQNSNDASGLYYLPIPGTGSAGSSSNCSVSDSDHDGDFDDDASVDDPCNWNKLLVGQSVSIPLYTDDDTGSLLFPYDLSGFTGWSLKVRTPCDASLPDNTDPETCTRYELDDGVAGSSSTYAYDDSIILWELTGTGTDSTSADYTVSVVPDDQTNIGRGGSSRNSASNTEIYESLINSTSNGNVVLQADPTAPYTDIYNTCMGDSDGDGTQEITFSDLTLHLNIVNPLKQVGTGDAIPYLEWQMSIDSSEPFADNKSVILGEGYQKGKKYTFYSKKTVLRSTTGESLNIYTLSN